MRSMLVSGCIEYPFGMRVTRPEENINIFAPIFLITSVE